MYCCISRILPIFWQNGLEPLVIPFMKFTTYFLTKWSRTVNYSLHEITPFLALSSDNSSILKLVDKEVAGYLCTVLSMTWALRWVLCSGSLILQPCKYREYKLAINFSKLFRAVPLSMWQTRFVYATVQCVCTIQ